MADRFSVHKRSQLMAQIRTRDTRPELQVRKAFHAAGLRYRLHDRSLPGTPDLVLSRHRVVVFINGCFWHGHSCAKGKLPSSNTAFWSEKIMHNRVRDARNENSLKALGWSPLVIWECEIKEAVPVIISELKAQSPSENITRDCITF
jgi:DNA mismatch endonuclease (patch repair protein)